MKHTYARGGVERSGRVTLLPRRLFVYEPRLPYDKKFHSCFYVKMSSEVPASLEHYLAKVQIIIPDNLRRKGQVEEHGGGGPLRGGRRLGPKACSLFTKHRLQLWQADRFCRTQTGATGSSGRSFSSF